MLWNAADGSVWSRPMSWLVISYHASSKTSLTPTMTIFLHHHLTYHHTASTCLLLSYAIPAHGTQRLLPQVINMMQLAYFFSAQALSHVCVKKFGLHCAAAGSVAKAKSSLQSPLHSHTSLSSLQRASSNGIKDATQQSAVQPTSRLNSHNSPLQRNSSISNSSSSNPSRSAQASKLQSTASVKSSSSLSRSSSNSSPRNPYLQGATQRSTPLQRNDSSTGASRKGLAGGLKQSTVTGSSRDSAGASPRLTSEAAASKGSTITQHGNADVHGSTSAGQTDAVVEEILKMPVVREKVCQHEQLR